MPVAVFYHIIQASFAMRTVFQTRGIQRAPVVWKSSDARAATAQPGEKNTQEGSY